MRETINNFYPEYNLHEAADVKHDTLSTIHFKNGYAYASNAYIAVRAALRYISTFNEDEIALMEGKSIDCNTFKALLQHENVKVREDGFEVEDNRTPLFYGFNRQQEFKFPDIENIIEQTKARLENQESVNRIGINIAYLSKLSKAMNLDTAKFDFNSNEAILVRDNNNEVAADNIQGVIMPSFVSED